MAKTGTPTNISQGEERMAAKKMKEIGKSKFSSKKRFGI